MEHERDAEGGPSRRGLLAAVGATSTALAGCTDLLSNDDDLADSGPWPALESGEVLSDFQDLEEWTARTGAVSAAPEEALTGSQAAVLESEGETAEMSAEFSDGFDLSELELSDSLDLEGWDVSLAVKPESATRIRVEFVAPSQEERLTSVRLIPDGFDGWFRLDCGYQQKPAEEPDLSEVTRIDVVAEGPDGGPTRLVVDDLRRTESADNGAAILAFYGGHDSHYDVAAELLEERGWTAAVPVPPERIGENGRMTREQLRDLGDRGWDVCPLPEPSTLLPEQSADGQRQVLEDARATLEGEGLDDGARHLFVPDEGFDAETYRIAREVYDAAFVSNSGTTGVPPTEMHAIPYIWGPALHTGVRRHVNLADQYDLLTVIRVPRLVDDDAAEVGVDENRMSIDDFGLLLEHIDHRGLDVVTPSDLVDGTFERDREEPAEPERPDGVVFEEGRSHAFDGSGAGETSSFDLEEGLLVATVSGDASEIAVDLVRDEGVDIDETLARTDGTDGESVSVVDGGAYRLEVAADGAWAIELTQPAVHSDDLEDLPVEASGSGSAFVGPLWTDGDVRVVATHDGDGPFVVDGHGADGHREVLVNRSDEFSNSRSYKAGGPVWLDVEGVGNWTLSITDP
ncbi:polysaccharide deacetylase [Natronococcus sp. JC468]|uniref:polysaccharide deacetylase family protein n=1 Tax=Natronococcus sp. JC468 TaxID=1961921 RepID=UPI001438C552|nr:polysaccharide deacetylase [Natronococcus sp. JC468]NKE36028.1 polysaccharide deacetylase [Natronococcus sp. JC468]